MRRRHRRNRKQRRSLRKTTSSSTRTAAERYQEQLSTTAKGVQFILSPEGGQYHKAASAANLDDLTVVSFTSISTQLSNRFRKIRQKLKETDGMDVLTSARRVICKKARVCTHQTAHPSEIELSFFSSYPAKAIYTCVGLTIMSRQPLFLYGILAVLWVQIWWIVLRWFLYFCDDPEVRNSLIILKGWLAVVARQGDQIVHGQNSQSWRLVATVASKVPRGIGIIRVFVRNTTANINNQVMEDLRSNIDSLKKLHRQVSL